MSKQYNIKFVIIRKILDIKFALFYITFKNDIANKKRSNLINKPIFKFQYSDAFFDSDSVFSFNFDALYKINIDILNL